MNSKWRHDDVIMFCDNLCNFDHLLQILRTKQGAVFFLITPGFYSRKPFTNSQCLVYFSFCSSTSKIHTLSANKSTFPKIVWTWNFTHTKIFIRRGNRLSNVMMTSSILELLKIQSLLLKINHNFWSTWWILTIDTSSERLVKTP